MSVDTISIIVPVLNEEGQIEEVIQQLWGRQSGNVKEIIVVDGGSDDGTVDVAESAGATIVHSERGRAKQMNAGAEKANGGILYFLHADTVPPKFYDREIINAVKRGYDFGCFRLQFDWNHPLLNFYSWFTRFRYTGLRFGDQSLFATKKVFEKAGGFKENLIVMEDQEIYRRLRLHGKYYLSEQNVITSARKYKEVGPVKLQFMFSLIWLGYYIGLKQNTLVNFYKRFILP
jgi:rSAM/selenodomain-associated transferase 2